MNRTAAGNAIAALMLVGVTAACRQPSNAAPAAQKVIETPAESNARAATEDEIRDVKTVNAMTDAVALEKASDDFARRYPQSKSRASLYIKAASLYATQHDSASELRAANKALAIAPHNAAALVMTASVLEQFLDASDIERATKMTAIRERIADALQHIDDDPVSDEQKRIIRAMAYGTLGTMELKTGDDAAAERDFAMGTEVMPQEVMFWRSLAVTQEHLKQYDAGLVSVEKALQLDPDNKLALEVQQDLKRLVASTAKARLIFGDPVTGSDGEWRFADGTPLLNDLIDGSTGRPPLVPRQQYSTKQAPVAGYIEQIRAAVNSVQSCQGLVPWMQFTASRFDMDDYGIVDARQSLSTGTDIAYGAALANLNLSKARTVPQKSGCFVVVIPCKGGSCVRLGNRATDEWQIMVKSGDDVSTVLAALSAIAPYYPDGLGEIK